MAGLLSSQRSRQPSVALLIGETEEPVLPQRTFAPSDPAPAPPILPSSVQTAEARPQISKEWEAIFQARGRSGLEQAFYDYARSERQNTHTIADGRERGNAEKSWDHLLDDEKQGTHRVLSLLHFLPDFLIPILLRGEYSRQLLLDPKVERYRRDHLKIEDMPCIYGNFLHGLDGLWLSKADMGRVLDVMEQYVTDDIFAQPTPLQRTIDRRISTWRPGKKEKKLIRWLPSQRAVTVLRDWIAQQRARYCGPQFNDQYQASFCPSEIGWATSSVTRLKAHEKNRTTYIFGLVSAILRGRDNEALSFRWPDPHQVILFPIWQREEKLIRLGEIVGSLLCLSLTSLGGFNHWHPGTMTIGDDDPDALSVNPPTSTELVWGVSMEAAYNRLMYQRPLEEETAKARDLKAMMNKAASRQDEEARHHTLSKDIKEQKDKHEALKKSNKQLEEEVAELRQKLPEPMPSTQQAAKLLEISQTLSRARETAKANQAIHNEWRQSKGLGPK